MFVYKILYNQILYSIYVVYKNFTFVFIAGIMHYNNQQSQLLIL